MKRSILLFLFLLGYFGVAQTNLNNYKYIIVPKQFADFKKENQYQTSTLIKHLFVQKGFEAVYEDEMPPELYSDRCLGLLIDIDDKSSMFATKVSILLKDCTSQVVFTTLQGKSRLKEFTASYNEALRGAFRTIDQLDYTYDGPAKKDKEPLTISFKNDVKQLPEKQEVKTTSAKNQDMVVQQQATEEQQSYKDLRPVASEMSKKIEQDEGTLQQVVTTETQVYKSKEPQTSQMTKAETDSGEMASEKKTSLDIWYAQELPNGYQLVDSTPRIRMRLFESSVQGVYHAKSEDKEGIVFTKDGKWFFEHYEGPDVIVQELNVKF